MFWSEPHTIRIVPALRPPQSSLHSTILNFLRSSSAKKLPSAYLPSARCYSSCIWLTKRLPRTLPDTVMASVLFKWIALMANITVMWVLARILGDIVTDGLSAALAVDALAQARRRHHRARRLHLPGPTRRRQGRVRGRPPRALARLRQAHRTRPLLHRDRPHRRGRPDQRRGRHATPGVLWRLPAAAILCRLGAHHAVCATRGPGGPSRRAAARLRSGHPRLHHDGHAQRQKDRCRVLGQLCRSGRHVPGGRAGSHHP